MPLPIPLARIAETEATLGASLPGAYKLHMSRGNGGDVKLDGEDWQLFPLRNSTSRETLRRSAEDVLRETQREIEAGLGFPEDGLAIASNGCGDVLLLRRQEGRFGNEVWVYRLVGGGLAVLLEDVGELWELRGDPEGPRF